MTQMNPSQEEHFDEMTALLFLEAQLGADQERAVSDHASACGKCGALIGALNREGIWLKASLAEEQESIPARLLGAPESGGAPWGWIATLGFAAAGVYTVWTGIIEPWQARAAQSGFTQGNLLTMLFFSGAFWKGWDAMRSLMEFLAVASTGMIAMWLLRRHWRRLTAGVAVVMGLVACILAISPVAQGAEVKRGKPSYTLEAGEEVKTDLIVFADQARIDGDVDGDLIAWSRNIVVNGHIKGDVLGGAEALRIDGKVDGNVRVFVQSFTLYGPIGKNLMSWCQDLDLSEKSSVGGTVTAGGENMNFEGQVGGDGLLFGDQIGLNGPIGGNLLIRGAFLTLGPRADIKGQVKFRGRTQPEVSESAKLASPIDVTIQKRGFQTDHRSPAYYWHQVLFYAARFVFGLALLMLVPRLFFDAASACKRFAQTFGFGVLFLFAVPIVSVLVCITVVGLGVGIAALLLYAIALYSGQVFVGAWLGERVLGVKPGVGSMIARLALGLAIIRVFTMIPVIGFFVSLIVAAWGLGALLLAAYRDLRTEWAPAM
jgi:cytoskeletal protein CcmA (bactofilin family)